MTTESNGYGGIIEAVHSVALVNGGHVTEKKIQAFAGGQREHGEIGLTLHTLPRNVLNRIAAALKARGFEVKVHRNEGDGKITMAGTFPKHLVLNRRGKQITIKSRCLSPTQVQMLAEQISRLSSNTLQSHTGRIE